MRPDDVLRTALSSLRGNLSRAALTILGLGIGVGACIAIGSLGCAAVSSVRLEMDRFGVDRIWVTDAPGSAARLSDREVRALEGMGGEASAVCRAGAKAQAGARSRLCEVVAVQPSYAAIENLEIACGRFLLAQDGQNLLRTAVIEDILVKELFGNADPVGRKMRIGENAYTVAGVIRTVTTSYFAADSGTPKIYVPLETYRQLAGRSDYDEIVLKTPGENVPDTARSVRTAMKNARGEDSVLVTSMYEQIASADRVLSIVTTVLIVVGLICMLTGGVGVMNIMLTGVRERRREIGVRKALGAKDSHIFVQFVCEAALYGACGAALGTLLGAVMTHLGQKIIGVEAHMVLWVTLCAIAFSCFVGAVCGVYPAMRAARVLPVEAMRQT